MTGRAWVTVALLCVNGALLALLGVGWLSAPAQAQVSEGRAEHVIAIATSHGEGSVLYLIDTSREVILVYGLHEPGPAKSRDLRSAAFEFLAGRLYRWDLLLASKREYALRGLRSLSGLRALGPGSSEEEYKRAGE